MEFAKVNDQSKSNPIAKNNLWKLWQLIPSGQRLKFIFLTIFILISAALEVIGIGLLVPVISLLTAEKFSSELSKLNPIFSFFGAKSDRQMLLVSLSLISLTILIKNLYVAFVGLYKFNLISKIRASFENQLLKKYITSDYEFHLQANSSVLLRNITSEIDEVIDIVLTPSIAMVTEIIVAVGLVSFLILFEPLAAISMLTFFGFCGFIYTKFIGPTLTRYGTARASYRARLMKSVAEVLGGFKEIKILGRESYFLNSFKFDTAKASRLAAISDTLQSLPLLFVELWGILGLVLVILVMLISHDQSSEFVSIFGLFAAASFRLLPSVNRILVAINGLRHTSQTIQNLHRELSDTDVSKLDVRANLRLNRSLEFKNVSFSYSQDSLLVLDALSFSVHNGEMLGILGPSGSGKTTLVDILLGLLTPTDGQVVVDGEIVDLSKQTWRNQVGYVPQDIYILDDSIRNNVAFGIESNQISDNRIMTVLKLAQIEEFYNSLDIGLDTNIGERGSRLSGGQKQRIGIARAIYGAPSLLVLDEPTSALDTESETAFIESLQAIRGKMTIVVISHKVSTLKYCDRLLTMRAGKLIDFFAEETER